MENAEAEDSTGQNVEANKNAGTDVQNATAFKSRKRKNGGLSLDNSFKYTIQDGVKFGTCKMCIEKPVIIKMKDSNTSGLKRHLKNCHPQEYLETYPSDNVSIKTFDQDTFDAIIVDWVTMKYLPFSFFEDQKTQDVFQYLKPGIKLPLRSFLKSQCENRYKEKQEVVAKILLQNSSKISFTIDGWTSLAHRSYYGITAHFINDDWILHSLVIDFLASNGNHTGRDIAELFYSTLSKYSLEDKVQGITVDNAAANTKFMEELAKIMINFKANEQHYRCFAHILNLAVQALLKILQIDDIKETDENSDCEESDLDDNTENEEEFDSEDLERTSSLAKIRSLFRLLKNSEQRRNKLNSCCVVCNVKFLSPNIDVSTRWNSTFDMLTLAFRMKPAINMLCENNTDLQKFVISAKEWQILEEASKYLEYFNVLSIKLSGEKYVTLPSVIIGFNLLLDKLEKAKDNLILKTKRTQTEEIIVEALEAALEKLLKHYKKFHWVYCAVLILDPRHKIETFQLTKWGKEMADKSIKTFEQIYKSQYYQKQVSLELEKEISNVPQTKKTEDKLDLDMLFLSDSESEDSFSVPKNSRSPRWKWEIECYCSQKHAGKNTDVLDWWKKNEKIFPNLSRMARDFLCTSATSVPSERLFSRSSLVIRKHRKRLSDDSITHLMCLNSWNYCSLTSEIDSLIKKAN